MHRHDAGCYVHTFPLFRSARCYAYHVCLHHPLDFFASLHACLHIHAWVLLDSVSSILQHNETMDIQFKPTFVPRGHHLLFAFLLVCLLSCLLVCFFAFSLVCLSWGLPCLLPYAILVISILLFCFVPFVHYLRISFFPLFVCCFLVFAFACNAWS